MSYETSVIGAVHHNSFANIKVTLGETSLKRSFKRNCVRKNVEVWAFTGGTGVGKTHVVKKLAEQNDKGNEVVTFDMASMREDMTARLAFKSTPPGFVGYDEAGDEPRTLAGKLRKNPNISIIFDEIEKGSETALKFVREIIQTGTLTDTDGTVLPFNNATIYITSYLPKDELAKLLSDEKNAYKGNIVEMDGPDLHKMRHNREVSITGSNNRTKTFRH